MHSKEFWSNHFWPQSVLYIDLLMTLNLSKICTKWLTFSYDFSVCDFLIESLCISIQISLNCVPKFQIENKSALGNSLAPNKILSESVLTVFHGIVWFQWTSVDEKKSNIMEDNIFPNGIHMLKYIYLIVASQIVFELIEVHSFPFPQKRSLVS